MNKLNTSLAVALGVGGCTTYPSTSNPSIDPPNATEARAAIREDLEKLRGLDIFSVGGIIRDLPEEATGCYFDDLGGLPCPGWEDEVAAADIELAPRVASFTNAAVTAAATADPAYAMDQDRIAADLDALRALAIIEVGSLITTVAENDPNCYNLPCPDDQQRADEENRQRAAKLDAIRKAVSE